ncbi:hypothetical protein BTUL_0113g00120 [Botrytis tulipae]|uniref:Uncharacterized protein n=1 Tax=Botrytis tulipae TaxID=87230 RepID=A0A4Z1EK85_9HELO|nr:hypothetical protein BTUL_0113g00120 [Botrytis tulipae]
MLSVIVFTSLDLVHTSTQDLDVILIPASDITTLQIPYKPTSLHELIPTFIPKLGNVCLQNMLGSQSGARKWEI